ncbi:retrovirus-related pol polyprotein from transposon TNT 1-94, partial [Tanacetum coccineum]
MATCHHLSGATWRKHCSPTVGQPPINRRRTTGQRWSTTVVNGGQRRSTPPDPRSTVVNDGSQRWSTAVNTAGPPVNGGGQRWSTVADHRSTVVDRHVTSGNPSGPKVVFGDDSTCTTEGYGSIKRNGIVFTKVSFINGVKYNLISISQLCDAKNIVQFDEKRGTIFNSNKEVVMISPRVRDVYVLDMTSSFQESCFFAKAFDNLNCLWHKRLPHLNFKTINKLTKQNLVIGLPSLVYSKNKPCSSCEKGKHHRAIFKTKPPSSIKKCLHLLHMNLFGHVTPRNSIIVNFFYIHNHKDRLGKFDEKADDGYLLGYSLVSKAFRVFNTRRQQPEETYHITFDESPNAIKFSKPLVDNINITKNERYPPDEYLHPYEPSQ